MFRKCILVLFVVLLFVEQSFAQGQQVSVSEFDSMRYSTSLSFSLDSKLAVAVQFPYKSIYVYTLGKQAKNIASINGFISPRAVAFSKTKKDTFYVTDSTRGAVFEVKIIGETYEITKTISLSKGVFGLAVDTKRNRLYVSNPTTGILSIVDIGKGEVIQTVSGFLGVEQALTLNADRTFLYAGSVSQNNIIIFDAKKNEIVKIIEETPAINAIAINASGARIYAVSAINNMMLVYSSATYKLLASVPTGMKPMGIAIAGNNSAVITANIEDGTLSVISTLEMNVTRTINLTGVLTGAIVANKNKNSYDTLFVLKEDMDILEINWPMGLVQSVIQ